jgi:ribosomal protein S18 acetylase RimI-like enzyme
VSSIRLEVLAPGDPRAAVVLRAYMDDISSSYMGRPATEEEVDEGLSAFPSDDLAPPTGLLVVALDGPAPVGCAGLLFGDDGIAEVKRVYVAPSHRRRGLGARLMGELERLAVPHGIRELRLDTRDDVVDARRLYERIGFQEVPAFNAGPYAEHWYAKRIS